MVFNWTGSHLGRDGRKGAGLSVLVVAVGCICVAAGAARAQTCPTGPCTAETQATDCEDGLFCTQATCILDVEGNYCFCPPKGCDDNLFCTIDSCNETFDRCDHTLRTCSAPTPYCDEDLNSCVQCREDDHCTTPLLCDTSSGTCVECLSDSQCQDGLFCNGFESCNSSTGLCQAGTPPLCKKCVGGTDDGDRCATGADCASPGTCTGAGPRTCFRGPTPGATCTSDANCGTGGKCPGLCFMGPTPGAPCSTDANCGSGGTCGGCSELRGACVQCDSDSQCSNSLYCDGLETCQSDDNCVAGAAPNCRRCVGGTWPGTACAVSADCDGGGTCPTTGPASYCDEVYNRCQVCLTNAHCDDGLFCTSDECTQYVGGLNVCNNPPDPDQYCDDGVACNGREDCSVDNTSCVPGTPVVCQKTCFLGSVPPGTACTSDAGCGTGGKCLGFCSETFGGCVQCENSATCNDGLFCNGTETCSPAGQCVAGTRPNCSSLDNPPCAVGACNESQDRCVTQSQNNGSQCEDADHCTASSRCSSGLCVNDPPTANDPYRCVRLEWRPSTTQTVKVGSTVTLSLYAVADQCNTLSDNCPANQAPVSGIATLLTWTPTVLELQASTSQNPNPQDPCNNSNACNQCQTCTGGSNPGASCTQQCVGGTNHGQVCFNSTQCPGGQCYSGPVCLGGTFNGNQCTVNGNCPGGQCYGISVCLGGTNNGNPCTTNGNCPGGTCNTTTGKCLGGGTCAAPTAYNWDSSLFPNDCPSSQMNDPCPSLGFPGNDGDAYYQSIQPLSCGSPPAAAPSACVPSTGLYVTNIKFKAISNPGGGAGTDTTVSFLPCGPAPARTIVQSILTPPCCNGGLCSPCLPEEEPDYFTDDVLKSLGPPANIKVVVCDVNVDCDDGDGCTLDVCANHVCQHTLRNCEDPDPCTIDSCVNGLCLHDPVPCAAGQICYLGNCYTPCSTVAQCDDGVACTVDTCDTTPPPPIDGICLHTPDDARCDTGLFCSAKVCDPVLGCVFDHECFGSIGNPCPVPSSCDENTNTCGGCNPPTAVGIACRYLAVTPAPQGSTPIALRVIGECHDTQSACVARYVQSKCNGGANNGQNCLTDVDCPKRCAGGTNNGYPCTTNGDCPIGICAGRCDAGTLGSAPFYKTASQWGTAMVRGAQIRPGADYLVETQCKFPGPPEVVVLSAATSARTWKWGDIDGDGDVDGLDIVRLVDAFKGIFGDVTFEKVNIWGCTPDGVIDALDITLDVDAFKGFAFPCGITCP